MSEEEKPPESAEKNNDKEYNFAQLRKQLESERAEKEKMVSEIEAIKAKLNAPKPEEEDDYEDPYVDPKYLKKQLTRFEERMQSKFSQEAEKKARELMEKDREDAFLKNTPDFPTTLTPDNIKLFAEKYPDIAEPLSQMPDSFARQKLLYQNIKALKIGQKEEQPSIQQTIDAKRRSPYYQPSGVPNAPYSAQGDFSPTGQKSAYEKMQEMKSKLRL